MGISAALGSSALLPAGLGFRNVVINGGFDVWQRGSSGTAIQSASASASFLADRWSTYRSTTGSTQSRISASLDTFQYAIRIQRDSGNSATNKIYLGTSFETSTATKLANKPVVLSFYARAGSNFSASSSLLNVLLSSGTGTEANGIYTSFTSATSVVSTTATLTTSWQRFIYYGVMPATSSQLLIQFDYTPVGTAGSNDYFDVTGVQLEQNYQPTPFEQRPYGVELQLCQRYFYAPNETDNNGYSHYGLGFAYSTTQAFFAFNTPVQMRVPITSSRVSYSTLRISDTVGAWAVTAISVSDYTKNRNTIQVDATIGTASLTSFRSALLQGNNSTSAYMRFDAEL